MTRRLVRLIALLLALTLIASACGGDDDDGGGSDDTPDTTEGEGEGEGDDGTDAGVPPDEDAGEPQTGGTLRVGLEAETDGLDPTTNRFAVAGYQMGNAVFDAIAAPNTDGQWVPYLAESFTPNDDFTEWDIKLREGITFHDGEPLNAEALIANLENALADPLVSLAVRAFFPEDDEAPFWEVVDDLTVRVFMRRPTANLPANLTGQLGMVASPKWLAATIDNPALKQEPVGTGPFVFDSRTPDQVTRFVRNEDWWNGSAYLDAIEFYPVTDSEVAAGQLIAGDLDSTGTTNADAIISLRETDGLDLIEDDNGEESFAMMNTGAPPFDDVRVREAITLATPRDDYIDFVGQGILRGADSMFTPDSPYYNPDVVQETDQPELAQALIDDYCAEFPDNCAGGKINVDLLYSGPSVIQDKIADILTDGWGDYFNVTPEVVLQDDLITRVAIGGYQIVTWRQFGAEDPDADMVWMSCESIVAGISLNWPKFCSEVRDAELFLQRATEGTDEERVEAWQEIAKLSNEAFTYIFFTHTLWTNAFADNVHGVCEAETPEGEQLYCTLNGRHLHSTIWLE
jgi:peptide/nickel transport system substrate-binding protein